MGMFAERAMSFSFTPGVADYKPGFSDHRACLSRSFIAQRPVKAFDQTGGGCVGGWWLVAVPAWCFGGLTLTTHNNG